MASFELLSTQKRWRLWCKVEQHCLRSTAASLWLHSLYPLHLKLRGSKHLRSLLFPSIPPSLRKLEVGVSPIHPAYLLRLTPASGTSGEHPFFELSLSNYPAMAFSIVVYSAHLCNLHESILIAGFATLPRIFIYCALVILHYCTLSEGFSAFAELDDGFRARPGSRAPILGRAVAGLHHWPLPRSAVGTDSTTLRSAS